MQKYVYDFKSSMRCLERQGKVIQYDRKTKQPNITHPFFKEKVAASGGMYILILFVGFLGQHSDVDPSKTHPATSSQASQAGETEAQPTVMKTVSSRMKNLMRDELLINVRKFETQVHVYVNISIHFTQ